MREQRRPYTILEGEPEPGGLCRTVARDGYVFDHVSHVLHFRSPQRRDMVAKLLGGRVLARERKASIYFRGRLVPYPFQGHLGFLPFRERLECVAGLLAAGIAQRLRSRPEPLDFAAWIDRHFGSGIARCFMTPYNEKLWRVPLDQVSCDWIRAYVPQTSIAAVLKSMLHTTTAAGYNSTFLYPQEGGMAALIRALEAATGGARCGRRAVSIDLDRRRLRFEDGEEVAYEYLVSTIPLRALVQMCAGVPPELQADAAALRSIAMVSLTYALRREVPIDQHWVYYPGREFPFFRLCFPSNVNPATAPAGCALIGAEISVAPGADPAELERATTAQLRTLGLIRDPADIVFIHRVDIPHAYPVHDLGRGERVARLRQFLRARGVWTLGRFGQWQYSSVDDALEWGQEAAAEIEKVASGQAQAAGVSRD